MSFSVVAKFGVSLVPVFSEQNTAPSTRVASQERFPLRNKLASMFHRAPSDDSLFLLTERSISLSPSKTKLLRALQVSPLPRSPSPVVLKYVSDRGDESSEEKSSSEHEKAHASNFAKKVTAALAERRVFPAIISASMISLPRERIISECEIFENVYALTKIYSEGSEEFVKYERIAWEALNRAFDFFDKVKEELDPDVSREVGEILDRFAARS